MGEARGHSNARWPPQSDAAALELTGEAFPPRGAPRSANTGSTWRKEGEGGGRPRSHTRPSGPGVGVGAPRDRSAAGSAHADLSRRPVPHRPAGLQARAREADPPVGRGLGRPRRSARIRGGGKTCTSYIAWSQTAGTWCRRRTRRPL